MSEYPKSKCRGCGRTIVWAFHPGTGKNVPLDPSAVIYRAVLMPNGKVECIKEYEDDLMVNHFNTCSKAGEFSKRGS